jgi:hypothetical protein
VSLLYLTKIFNITTTFLMLRATPLDTPELWGQFDPVNIQDVLLVYVNGGVISKASWHCAAFDLEVFRSTRGLSRLVHITSSEGRFETVLLSTWVTTCKRGLRGNSRGVLYYHKEKGWQRLHILLDELQEVITVIMLVLIGSGCFEQHSVSLQVRAGQ